MSAEIICYMLPFPKISVHPKLICYPIGDLQRTKEFLLNIFSSNDLGFGGKKIHAVLDAFPWAVYDSRMLVNLLNSTLRSTLRSVTRGDKEEYDKLHASQGETGDRKVCMLLVSDKGKYTKYVCNECNGKLHASLSTEIPFCSLWK